MKYKKPFIMKYNKSSCDKSIVMKYNKFIVMMNVYDEKRIFNNVLFIKRKKFRYHD